MDISKEELITNTFYITYVFLITTGTITFIESLRTKEEKVRNILNLETCISVIAAFFYGKFVKDLDKGIDYKKINETRYVDWAITTPIMLLVLVWFIQQQRRRVEFLEIFGYFGSQLCDVGVWLCRRTRIDGQNHFEWIWIRGFRGNVLLHLPKLYQRKK